MCLDDALAVYPAHDYKGRAHTTIGAERANNARLKQRERAGFVELMRGLDIAMPEHLSEALRTNRTGGKTVTQLIAEAARGIAFMSMQDAKDRIELGDRSLLVLDVRERDAFRARHLPGALNIPRGELELRADRELVDPTLRILTYCEYGKISTLAAHTLRSMGFGRTVALDGGLDAWSKAGFPVVNG
jgi:rhodanese-related sulfurtransferase